MKILAATALRRALRGGSSLPLVVDGEGGGVWVVKARGSGDGVSASAAEWIALRLAAALDVPTPEPHLLRLEAKLAEPEMDPEIRELIERSLGVNLATRWIEDARELRAEDELSESLRDRIFLYDLFLLNMDRTTVHPNLVISGGRPWCLDYASAMLLRGLLDGRPPAEEPFLRQLRRHPFYRPNVDRHGFIRRLRALETSSVEHAVAGLPNEWHIDTQRVVAGLISALSRAHVLSERLDRMRTMVVESEEQRRARIRRNRAAFERGGLL